TLRCCLPLFEHLAPELLQEALDFFVVWVGSEGDERCRSGHCYQAEKQEAARRIHENLLRTRQRAWKRLCESRKKQVPCPVPMEQVPHAGGNTDAPRPYTPSCRTKKFSRGPALVRSYSVKPATAGPSCCN